MNREQWRGEGDDGETGSHARCCLLCCVSDRSPYLENHLGAGEPSSPGVSVKEKSDEKGDYAWRRTAVSNER